MIDGWGNAFQIDVLDYMHSGGVRVEFGNPSS